MIQRIIPVILLIFSSSVLLAQTPETLGNRWLPTTNRSSLACGANQNPNAGRATPQRHPDAQSNNVQYLCLGDSLNIVHNGQFNFSGDPDMSTQAGVGYAFYSPCAPSSSGPELADVLNDPCLLNMPPPSVFIPGVPDIYIFTDDTEFNGNTTFWNTANIEFPLMSGNFLTIQDFFNAGDPFRIIYAPITVDDFETNMFESNGPCINVNITDTFSVVYLNEITASPLTLTAGGSGCVAQFDLQGGLPEYDGSFYTLNITSVANPSAEVYFDTPFSHDSTVIFTVNEPGLYNVEVSDGVSCGLTFQVNMGTCVPTEFSLPVSSCRPPGSSICLPITTTNFSDVSSFNFTVRFDDALLDYTNINPGIIGPPDLLINAGNPDFLTFSWLNGQLNPTPISFPDGTVLFEICYNVIGANNSVATVEFSSNPIPLQLEGIDGLRLGFQQNEATISISACNLAINFATCTGRADTGNPLIGSGSIIMELTSGTGPFTYTYEEDTNSAIMGSGTIAGIGVLETISNLPPGTYTVTITDGNGAQQIGSVTIADGQPLIPQTTTVDPTCFGDSDGKMFLTITGGVGPFGITWSNGATNIDSITMLPSNNYSVVITDANGCMVTAQEGLVTSMVSANLVNQTNVSCNGNGMDGGIRIVGTGGTVNSPADYTYLWSDGSTTDTLSDLMPGRYCVIVTDANGCQSMQECFDILDGERPVLTGWNIVNVQCSDDTNGSLEAIIQATNAPVNEYNWTYPDGTMITTTVPQIIGLGAGKYYLTAVATDGCSLSDSAIVMGPAPLSIDMVTLRPPTCPGDSDGRFSVTVSGGTMPYTYTWRTPDMTTTNMNSTLAGLAGDIRYQVTIVDGNGCDSISLDTLLPNPPAISIFFDPASVTMTSCSDLGSCDAQATALASGGTAGSGSYNFTWGTGETTFGDTMSTAVQLCQGWNVLTVFDGNCSAIDSIEIIAPPPLLIDISQLQIVEPSCNDGDDGSITVAATGGTPMYSYAWDNMETTQTITGLMAGDYQLTIEDSNGCDFNTTITVQEPDILIAQVDSVSDVSCNGESDGYIELNPSGGTLPYSYLWENNVSNTNTALNLLPGAYSVTIVDARGCTDSTTVTINEPPVIEFIVPQPDQPTCFGFQTVITLDTAWGGSGGLFEFSVENGPRRRQGAGIPVSAGTYTVQIYDGNGCFVETILDIGQPAPVIVSLGNDIEIKLGDSTNILPTFSIDDGTVDSIIWSPLDTFLRCIDSAFCKNISVKPLESTLYTMTIIDSTGCIGTDEILIEVDKDRNVFIPNIFTPNGDGSNDVFKPLIGAGVTGVNFFRIFDRWGELIYSDENFLPNNNLETDGWDGMFNGKTMKPAVFVYLIEVEFIDGVTLLYRGDITLMR